MGITHGRPSDDTKENIKVFSVSHWAADTTATYSQSGEVAMLNGGAIILIAKE
jgi:hypothetical protein